MSDAKIRAEDVAYVDRLRKERAALLAVAKAAVCAEGFTVQLDRELRAALDHLDAAHPGWLKWDDELPPSYPIIHGRPHDARTAWDHE